MLPRVMLNRPPRARMQRRLHLVSAIVASSLALSTPILISPSVAIAAKEDPNAKIAREAFSEGQVAFNLGQWDKAIEAWQKGYKAKPDPVFLYNIAQAYRKKGEFEQAVFFYKSFLHNTSNAPNREEVVGWIDQLERQAAEERQRKAEEEKQKAEQAEARRLADEQQRRDAEQKAAEQVRAKQHKLRGDLGLLAGVSLWVAGAEPSVDPSAAIELTGGYTILEKGRLRFRLGATVGFTYLKDVSTKLVNAFGLLVDPTLKVDVWKQKLFFFVQVGLGGVIITGIPVNTPSALLHAGKATDGGVFGAFEARPAVGLEYVPIPRLSVLLAPGVAVSTPPTQDFNTLVRVQILAGLLVHL
jgi:hypothetical protein